ncbi:hypothetical protein HK101_009164 [Irineochytrium annulatum]|nr:hypothetical protein HK101_009164 [Irineochytrium annulatum]
MRIPTILAAVVAACLHAQIAAAQTDLAAPPQSDPGTSAASPTLTTTSPALTSTTAASSQSTPAPGNVWGCTSDKIPASAANVSVQFQNVYPLGDINLFYVTPQCAEVPRAVAASSNDLPLNQFAQVYVRSGEVYLTRSASTGAVVDGLKVPLALNSSLTWNIGSSWNAAAAATTAAVATVTGPAQANTSTSSSSGSKTPLIVGVVVVGLVVAVIAAVGIVVVRRRRLADAINNGYRNGDDVKVGGIAMAPASTFAHSGDAYADYRSPSMKKGVGFSAETNFESSGRGGGGGNGTVGRKGTLGSVGGGNTFGRTNAVDPSNQMTGNPNQAPAIIVAPPTIKRGNTVGKSKAAKRASLAWWAAPGFEQKQQQQQGAQLQEGGGPEEGMDGGESSVGGRDKSFFTTVNRTVATMGAGAGSANNFDYYDMHRDDDQTLQVDPSTIPAPNAMGPGSKLRVIHSHRAELEDELTMFHGDTVILMESYGDGWCLAKVVRSKREHEGGSRVGEDGMLPVACLDIMNSARASVAIPKKGKRVKSLLRPESVMIFEAAGRDIERYSALYDNQR